MTDARTPGMRLGPLVLGLAMVSGCTLDEPSSAPFPVAEDVIWAQTIRPGDMIVAVPGTGSYDYLAKPIEAYGQPHPVVDVRKDAVVESDAVVFEQAIAAARRAGMTDDDIERGAFSFLLWGCGFTSVQAFDYISYEGVRLRVDVLGGENAVARGSITDHLLDYTVTSASVDARDLYTRLRTWLGEHPATSPRNAVVVSHSWGGAVAEYLALELPVIAGELGPLPRGTAMPFTVAAGVPAFILGYAFQGPRMVDYTRPSGDRFHILEIERPDDPVHQMTFQGNFGGHHYNIVVGEDFLGSYGITTDQLSCQGVAGMCGS